MTTHFTGCNHFGHWAIAKYCNRPFDNLELMDETQITEWNRVVKPDDTVYQLGDFTFGNRDMAQRYFKQLNGMILVLGNRFHHDKRWLPKQNYAEDNNYIKNHLKTKSDIVVVLPSIHTLKVDDLFIVLCHFPLASWPRQHYGSLHFHAHSHSNYQGEGKILDVGVDNVNKIWGSYRPVSLTEIVEYMEER